MLRYVSGCARALPDNGISVNTNLFSQSLRIKMPWLFQLVASNARPSGIADPSSGGGVFIIDVTIQTSFNGGFIIHVTSLLDNIIEISHD